jgi:hypothetical protein
VQVPRDPARDGKASGDEPREPAVDGANDERSKDGKSRKKRRKKSRDG